MDEKDLEYRLDSIDARLSSLEKKVGSIEASLNSMMKWRAVQDRMWEERDKMNGNVSNTIASIETKLDSLKDEVIELKTINRQQESDQNRLFRKLNIMLATFAGLMMLGTLIVQIVMAAK